jgi:hypothetical protein
MVRRDNSTFLVAAALIVILLVAFILSLAQDKLPELALDLVIYLFMTTLAVFVVGRVLAWRDARQWFAAKEWLYIILLEAVDDLLKELLPATVPREGVETDEEVTVYEVASEWIHFGETVAYSPLQLLIGPDEKDLESHIIWYAEEMGSLRYLELAKEAMSDARGQVRDTLGSSDQLLEAEITSMLLSFDQAIAAAIGHMDTAAKMRNEKMEDASYRDDEPSAEWRMREADYELAFVSSIIVEAVVDSAIKPKAWFENELLNREGQSSLRRLQA